MIISRTPFRISFAGGGSDLPEFYRIETGAVVSTAINKYMYIIVNKRFDDSIRVSYSKTEIVRNVEQIRHPIVREALKLTGITKAIEVVSIADIPAGTGLGSSSSFAVGLLNALYAYKGIFKSAEELARDACHLEIDTLREPIGKQDQFIAAFGGLRYIQFYPDGTTSTEPIIYADKNKDELSRNLLLFFTGETRQAGDVLRQLKINMVESYKLALLKKMRDMAIELKNHFSNDSSPHMLGEFLHQGWILKKQLSANISNNRVDEYYQKALNAGALGGKIVGAGGGGFLLLYCPKNRQTKVQQALNDLPVTKFSLEPEGSMVISEI